MFTHGYLTSSMLSVVIIPLFNPDLVGPAGWLYMVLPRIVFLVDIPFSLMTDGLYTEGGIFLIKFLL